MIAVVIFPILSTGFLAMYFTTDGNASRRQNNKGNESKNCTVKCSANQTKSHNSGTGYYNYINMTVIIDNLL